MDTAFWVYNLVANLAYGERYADVMPLVQEKIQIYQVDDLCGFTRWMGRFMRCCFAEQIL